MRPTPLEVIIKLMCLCSIFLIDGEQVYAYLSDSHDVGKELCLDDPTTPLVGPDVSNRQRHSPSTLSIPMPVTIFDADFENSIGDNAWTLSATAGDGNWIVGVPTPYTTVGTQMEIAAFQGAQAFVTGSVSSQDVDGGPTIARSPTIVLDANASSIDISFSYYFSHYSNSSADDNFVVRVRDESNDAILTTLVNELGTATSRDAVYQSFQQSLLSLAGTNVYLELSSQDISNGSKVEAAIDAISITQEITNTQTLVCNTLISDDFESGIGNWVDGGSDCTRFDDDNFANSGDFSIRLRDNTSTSVMTSGPYDLGGVDEITIDFSYLVVSFEGTEDFWFQTSSDGTSFNTERIWIRTVDFDNDVRENESFTLLGPFSSTTYFRFRADASGNADLVYIDDVVIQSCTLETVDPVPLSQGLVFYDYNNNGVSDGNDYGIAGVVVNAFDDSGLVESVITDSNGDFSFSTLSDAIAYRIEFSGFPTDFTESTVGLNSNSSVQYRRPGSNDPMSLGLIDPYAVCDEDPFLILPCYVEGAFNGNFASEYAFVKVLQSAEGHDFNGLNYGPNYQVQPLASHQDIGSVYGVAWQVEHSRLFTSAFYKRYVGFGPAGPDAIYQMDIDGTVTGILELDLLTGTADVAGADSHDFTAINGEVYDLAGSDDGFNHVGKRSFGDIELSSDGQVLYAVNLHDRKVYAIDVSDPNTNNASLINSWNAPDATGQGRHRPFGLAYRDDLLYIGSVDENGSTAYVHSLKPQTGATTLVLSFGLTYQRQAFFGSANNSAASADWNPWAISTSATVININSEIAYPQAILADIEFDRSGDMVVGLRDRFGDQVGADKLFSTNSTTNTWGISSGDILKACQSGSTYTIESGLNGTCPVSPALDNSGPGGVEFYHWDIFTLEQNTWNPYDNTGAFHWEIAQGALYQPPGTNYVISIASDPFDDFSGGFIKFNNITGEREGTNGPTATSALVGGYTIYESGDFVNQLPAGTFTAGKANGLGDIEAACSYSIQIGNYVWYDADGDGIQDPSEPPLADVLIELYSSGTKVGEALTDDQGYYYFGGADSLNLINHYLLLHTSYELRVNISSAQANDGTITTIGGLTINDTNGNNVDLIDSDGVLSSNGLFAVVSFTTGTVNENNYSFDFGFDDCQSYNTELVYQGCQGDGYSISVNGTLYDESNQTGIENMLTTAGCDSVVTVSLTFSPEYTQDIDYVGCSGDGYGIIVNGIAYNESNPIGVENLLTASGCDSIININLIYNPRVTVEAGMLPYSICSTVPYVNLLDLGASISGGATTGLWTTIGDGSFDFGGIFNVSGTALRYTLGPQDLAKGEVILTLTSTDPPGPCEPAADAVLIQINDLTCSQFPWAGN